MLWILALMVFGVSCARQALDEKAFMEVFLAPLDQNELSLDSVVLRGVVLNAIDKPFEVGFITADSLNEILKSPESLPKMNVQNVDALGNFKVTQAVKAGKITYYRAFAQLQERIVYSADIRSYDLGKLVEIIGSPEVDNNEVFMRARIKGLETTQSTLTSYGFVYAENDPTPEIGPNCLCTQYGNLQVDTFFSDTLKNLKFNTNYYCRAFIVTNAGSVIYSETTTMPVKGGWSLAFNTPTPYQEGSIVAVETANGVFMGFGCTSNDLICYQSNLAATYYQLSVNDGTATVLSDFPGQKRTNVLQFAIADTIYVIGGGYFEAGSTEELPVRNFFKYSISAKQWFQGVEPTNIPRRTGAVAFILNGKAYIGAGKTTNGSALNDFWEYSPATATWKSVQAMPAKKSTTSPVENIGRYEAVAFTIGQNAYVGGGENNLTPLQDFWKFTAPNPNAPNGEWTLVDFFPGRPRVEAVAFSIQDKGYYGTGFNPDKGELNDFWVFDPQRVPQWKAITPFKGGNRRQNMAFAFQSHGYVGTGLRKQLTDDGNNVEDIIFSDFWKYTPDN
ncbi:MAG: kelch repeat-containing protein [Saprospiraceae bacterium]|nr:kelch repeat-containing protein [Saprospiraceae bacterium]